MKPPAKRCASERRESDAARKVLVQDAISWAENEEFEERTKCTQTEAMTTSSTPKLRVVLIVSKSVGTQTLPVATTVASSSLRETTEKDTQCDASTYSIGVDSSLGCTEIDALKYENDENSFVESLSADSSFAHSSIADESFQIDNSDISDEEFEDADSDQNENTEIPKENCSFVVFWLYLFELLKPCIQCGADALIEKVFYNVSMIGVSLLCAEGHSRTWRSQPMSHQVASRRGKCQTGRSCAV